MKLRSHKSPAVLMACLLCCVLSHAAPASAGSARPKDIDWKNHPVLPSGAKMAVLYGNLAKEGLYTYRVRVPKGMKVMPHTHPDARVYTVISGIFYVGFGNTYDESKLEAYPQGSLIIVPANAPHFQGAASGYTIQISGVGPTSTEFVNPSDDPRKTGIKPGGNR